MTGAADAEVFLARQPIFDRDLNLYAYELLYRTCRSSSFDASDGDDASEHVVAHAALTFGVASLLGGKRAFINFTHRLLVSDLPSVLPPEAVAIEVLETVAVDDALLDACRSLRARGYLIALDDFVETPDTGPLAALADIIKVDFRSTSERERSRMLTRYGRRGVRMLAEKIETRQEFELARDQGFTYFQGYFFARPVILERKEIPAQKARFLRLLAEMQCTRLDFLKIETLIRQETSLCYQLLRYVNSAAYPTRTRIRSIGQALVLAGEDNLRKFVALASIHSLAEENPPELVATAALRARFAELIGPEAGLAARSSDLFLMGMFSLLDAMVGRPLEELLRGLPLPDDIQGALLAPEISTDRVACIHRLVLAYERVEWDSAAAMANALGVPDAVLAGLYRDAAAWCRDVFGA